MNPEQLWRQADVVRAITLLTFEGLSEETADLVPLGWNNSIRWNLGHILMTQDQLAGQFAGIPSLLPPSYKVMFGNRSKPVDWTEAPPSLDTLRRELEEQTGKLRSLLEHRMEEKVPRPFVRLGRAMETIGELVAFSLYHEGSHVGAISGLKKAIAAEAERTR